MDRQNNINSDDENQRLDTFRRNKFLEINNFIFTKKIVSSTSRDKDDGVDYSEFFHGPIKARRLPLNASKRPELPARGRNKLKFFNYDKLGELRTKLTPDHRSFMYDTGIIAMDCEMVGVGTGGKKSALARVTMVNEYGFCIYDKYVKPQETVTNYRTPVSGIRKKDLRNAERFLDVQKEVKNIIESHILVGQSVDHDLEALKLAHPDYETRDTASYFKSKLDYSRTPGLRHLAEKLLHMKIQVGEHCPIMDAQAAMGLYQLYRRAWEKSLRDEYDYNVLDETLKAFEKLIV